MFYYRLQSYIYVYAYVYVFIFIFYFRATTSTLHLYIIFITWCRCFYTAKAVLAHSPQREIKA